MAGPKSGGSGSGVRFGESFPPPGGTTATKAPGSTTAPGQKLSSGQAGALAIAGIAFQASGSKFGAAAGSAISVGASTGSYWAAAAAFVVSFYTSTRSRKKQKQAARRATALLAQLRGSDSGRAVPLLYGRAEAVLLRAYARAGNSIPLDPVNLRTDLPGALQRLGNLSRENQLNRKDNRVWLSQHVITPGQTGNIVSITVNGRFITDKLFNERLWIERRHGTASPVATAFEQPGLIYRSGGENYRGSGQGLRDATATFTGLSYLTLGWYHAQEHRNISLPLEVQGFGQFKWVKTIIRSGAGTEADPYTYALSANVIYSNNQTLVLLDRLLGGEDGYYSCGVVEGDLPLDSWYAAQEAAGTESTQSVTIKWPTGTSYAQSTDTNNPWGRLNGLGEFEYHEADFNLSTTIATPRLTLKRYEYNGGVDTEEEFLENLSDILDAAPGMMMFMDDNGQLALSTPDATTPEETQSVLTLGDADIVIPTEITVPNADSMVNTVSGRYKDNLQGSSINTLDFPLEGSPLDLQLKAADNNVRLDTPLDVDGVDNVYHMTDFLDTFLSVSRRRIYRTVTTLVGEGLEPGDVYTINDSRAGLRDIHCRLLQQPEYNDESSVAITGIFFDRTDYEQSFDLATASYNAQEFPTNTLLPPTSVAATLDSTTGVVRVGWNEPDNQADTFAGYTVERKIDDGSWDALAVIGEDETTFADTPPLTSMAIDLTYRVNSRGYLGDTSDWVEAPTLVGWSFDALASVGPFTLINTIPLGGCPDDDTGGTGTTIYDEINKILYQKGLPIWNEIIGAGRSGVLARFDVQNPVITGTTLTLDAPNTAAARLPSSVLTLPPGYVDNIVVTRATGAIAIDLKDSATGPATDDEELSREFNPLIVIAMRDTTNDDDPGIAFVRDTPLMGDDPYSYTPVNSVAARAWVMALSGTSEVEVAVLNVNRRCQTDPLNRWFILESSIAAKYRDLTVYRASTKGLPLTAADRPTGSFVFSQDFLSDVSPWTRVRPRHSDNQIIWAVSALANTFEGDVWIGEQTDWTVPEVVGVTGERIILYRRSLGKPTAPVSSVRLPTRQESTVAEPWEDSLASAGLGRFGFVWITYGTRDAIGDSWVWTDPSKLEGQKRITLFTTLPGVAPPAAGETDRRMFPAVPALADYNSVTETFVDDDMGVSSVAPWSIEEPEFDELQRVLFRIEGYVTHGPQPAGVWSAPAIERPVYRSRIIYRLAQERPPPPPREDAFMLGSAGTSAEPASGSQGLLALPVEPSGGVSGQIDRVVGQQAITQGIASVTRIAGGVYIILLSPILEDDQIQTHFLAPLDPTAVNTFTVPDSDIGFLDAVIPSAGSFRSNQNLFGGIQRDFQFRRGGVDIGSRVRGTFGDLPLLVQTIEGLTLTPGHEQLTIAWIALGAPVPARHYLLRYRGIGNVVTEPLPPEVGEDDQWTNADVVAASGSGAPAIGRAFQLTADKATTTVHNQVPIRVPLTVTALVRIEGDTKDIDGINFGLQDAAGANPLSIAAAASNAWTRVTGTITVATGLNTPGVQVDAGGWPLTSYGDDGDVASYNNVAYTKQSGTVYDAAVLSNENSTRQNIDAALQWAIEPIPSPQIPTEYVSGGAGAYAALLRFEAFSTNIGALNRVSFVLSPTANGADRFAAGPQLTDGAIEDLSLVLRDGRGRTAFVELADLFAADTVEPYRVAAPKAIEDWVGAIAKRFIATSHAYNAPTETATLTFADATLPDSFGSGLSLTQLTLVTTGGGGVSGHFTMNLTGGDLSDELERDLRVYIRYTNTDTNSGIATTYTASFPGPNHSNNPVKDTSANYSWSAAATNVTGSFGLLSGSSGTVTDIRVMLVDEGAREGTDYYLVPKEGRNPLDIFNPWVIGGIERAGYQPFVEKDVTPGGTSTGLVQFSDFTIHDDANKPPWIELQVANNSQTLTGLDNSEAYEAEVRGVSALGDTEWAVAEDAVLPRRPNAPTAAAVRLSTTDTAVSLEWDEVPDELAEYKIQVAAVPQASGAGVSGQQAPPPSFRDVVTGHRANSFVVRDLLQGEVLMFRIESENPGGTTAGPASDPFRIGYSEDGLRMPEGWFDHPPQGAYQLWASKQELITNKNTGSMFYRYERPLPVRGEVDDRDLREVGEWQAGGNYRDGDISYTREQITFNVVGSGGNTVPITLTNTKRWVCIRQHINASAASRPTNNANEFWRIFDPGLELDITDNPVAEEVADTTADHGLTGKVIPFNLIQPGIPGVEYQPNSPGEISLGSLLNGVFTRLGPDWGNALGVNIISFSFFDTANNDNTFYHRSIGGAVVQGLTVEMAVVDGQRWIKYKVLQARESLNTNRCTLSLLPIDYNSRGDTSDLSNDGSLAFSLPESLGETVPSSRTERRYRLSSQVLNRLMPADQGIAAENHLPLGWDYERPNPTTGQDVWRIQRVSSYRGTTFQSATIWSAPIKVQDRIMVVLTPEDYIYQRGDPNVRPATPVTPDAQELNANYTPPDWTRVDPGPTVTLGVWRSTRIITRSGTGLVTAIGAWGRPTRVSDAIGDSTQTVTRYIFIAQAAQPPTPATSDLVPPAGWTDGGLTGNIPAALVSEPAVWISQRSEERYVADPVSVASFGAWSTPSNARGAVTPTVSFGPPLGVPPQVAVTVSWRAFANPTSILLVEAQIQTSTDGVTWGAASVPQSGGSGSGNGGSVSAFGSITPGRWVRARTRAVFATIRGDWSAWSAGVQSDLVPLPAATATLTPMPNTLWFASLGRSIRGTLGTDTGFNTIDAPVTTVNLAGAVATFWQYRSRVVGTTAWSESGNLPIASSVASLSNLVVNREYEAQVRLVPSPTQTQQGYEAGEWSGSRTISTAALATPPAPALTAGAGSITVAAPTTVATQTGWTLIYRRVGDTSSTPWFGQTGGLIANGAAHTITGLTAGETYIVRVRRAGPQLGSLYGAAAQATPT